MGVLSNTEIRAGLDCGDIVIDPFNAAHLNTTSYDVTLGRYFFKAGTEPADTLYNPYDSAAVDKHFGDVMEAEPFSEHRKIAANLGLRGLNNLDPQQRVIILRPGERILGHTHEFIGIRNRGTTSMQARSTTGRNGIAVCFDAGWGDTGYTDRWTMEIMNVNETHVVLPEGIRIAQIVFHHTGVVLSDYTKISGKYTPATNLDDIKRAWRPENMKPKAFKDTIQPLPELDGLGEGIV